MPRTRSAPTHDLSSEERILTVATEFFARKGYYGTALRDIASAVNLSVATIYYYIQNKEDLYIKVFQRQYIEESALIAEVLASGNDDTCRDPAALRQLLYRLVDMLIDRSVANPDIVRLWTWRWLERPEKTVGIENEYFVPLYQKVEKLLDLSADHGIIHPSLSNLDIVSHSFTWLHYGYFGLGRLTFRTHVNDPLQPGQIEEFRAFIHTFIDRMLRFSDQT